MAADVAFLDLRMRRRSLIGYSVGMAVYALVIVALYPTFKNDTSLERVHQEQLHRRRAVRRQRAH